VQTYTKNDQPTVDTLKAGRGQGERDDHGSNDGSGNRNLQRKSRRPNDCGIDDEADDARGKVASPFDQRGSRKPHHPSARGHGRAEESQGQERLRYPSTQR
jgi:hypothetical protein